MIFIPRFSFIAVNIDMGFDPMCRAYEALEKYFQKIIIATLWKGRILAIWLTLILIKKIPVFFVFAAATQKNI